MNMFGIGLDQSVMNEPTQINLADWSNLCLFRLSILKRRVSSITLYLDRTDSAEALFKIEAFLYSIFQVCMLYCMKGSSGTYLQRHSSSTREKWTSMRWK